MRVAAPLAATDGAAASVFVGISAPAWISRRHAACVPSLHLLVKVAGSRGQRASAPRGAISLTRGAPTGVLHASFSPSSARRRIAAEFLSILGVLQSTREGH